MPDDDRAGQHRLHGADVGGRVDDERPHPDRAPGEVLGGHLTISAMAAESRRPVKTNGAACGSATAWPGCVARAVPHGPRGVQQQRVDLVEGVDGVERIGHTAAYTASVILASGPTRRPGSPAESVATDGIGRRNSTSGPPGRRAHGGTLPSSRPAGTATATAMPSAIATPARWRSRRAGRPRRPSSSATRTSTDGGGMNRPSTRPTRTATSHPASTASSPAAPRIDLTSGSSPDHRRGVHPLAEHPALHQQVRHALQLSGVDRRTQCQQFGGGRGSRSMPASSTINGSIRLRSAASSVPAHRLLERRHRLRVLVRERGEGGRTRRSAGPS